MREIERQVTKPTDKLVELLKTAHRVHAQQRNDKNKIYSVHEPEVECIAKGKAGKKYEFGNKVSVAVTSRGGWLVGAKSYTGNPYDGHTLAAQLEQVNNLIGDKVSEAYVDMGYRGHDYEGEVTVRVDKRRRGRTPRPLWRWMKRRAAVEPSIGHLKAEHRLERNRLEGRCRRCDQCHPECRGDELPEAPGSFLAQFSALPAARMGLDSGPTRATPPSNAVCGWLKATFSGSTK